MLPIDHFVRVISCTACPAAGKLLRDRWENVPQPGFVGVRYEQTRVLLVGKNPATPPPELASGDRGYTQALRNLRDQPTVENYTALQERTKRFMESWPIQQRHFPLEEFGLEPDDIAFCNIVRCREGTRSCQSSWPGPVRRRTSQVGSMR